MSALDTRGVQSLRPVVGVFREIGDLKRVRVAHAAGSVAERGFIRAWAALVGGDAAERVAAAECAAAMAGSRLGGIDAEVLHRTGLDRDQVREVLARAVDEASADLDSRTYVWVRSGLPEMLAQREFLAAYPLPEAPDFVRALCAQPRAGVTAPGRPRMMAEPVENHAEHCWTVAVYAALLAPSMGAGTGDAFLLGLAHHLHNAALPDAGFAGEFLLGEHLDGMTRRCTSAALRELSKGMVGRIISVLAAGQTADSPLGRAFHAADALDRVLQVHHHARAAAFTVAEAVEDMDLIHAGPVQGYQRAILQSAGLAGPVTRPGVGA